MLSEMIMGKRPSSREVQLTKRETEILTLIASEHTNQQIAEKLFISLRTVECHRLNITQKLNIKHMAGLVKEAMMGGGDKVGKALGFPKRRTTQRRNPGIRLHIMR
ncbi:response regulator transcription factor [Chitinophaga rhizosphaerae]|uniref:response regulator transcription factor n=1 Tax=Chitinophaga rhizosphaerae TaxID=1864947 RepID=UPI000F80C6A1|nr:helix-turn-helix transcriptional regulator [Chitinophaga rhizosphaerae]